MSPFTVWVVNVAIFDDFDIDSMHLYSRLVSTAHLHDKIMREAVSSPRIYNAIKILVALGEWFKIAK